jgi:hypothetical protein
MEILILRQVWLFKNELIENVEEHFSNDNMPAKTEPALEKNHISLVNSNHFLLSI